MSVVSSVRLLARLRAERDAARREAAGLARLNVFLRGRVDVLEAELRETPAPDGMVRVRMPGRPSVCVPVSEELVAEMRRLKEIVVGT